MFTGIIEEIGKILSVQVSGESGHLKIEAEKVLKGTAKGDSIAVNGVCLTVTERTGTTFTADVMAESLRRTNLGALSPGDLVNLERAMPADGRFGGHIVSGHVDGVGKLAEIRQEGIAKRLFLAADQEILKLLVEKGSVCMDGISLTVISVDDTGFSVGVIPHTAENTTLLTKRVGDRINIETDVIGKYVKKLLGGGPVSPYAAPESGRSGEARTGGLTMEFLLEHGI